MSRQARKSAAAPPGYGEIADETGVLREAWRPLIDLLKRMPTIDFSRRNEAAQAMLRDNGVTYNVYGEASGQTRRWQLDIVPFIISSQDWTKIEAAAIQRARLADALLADIYGAQRLIAEGFLPPHIVYGHPQFLRPLVGTTPMGGVRVHLYSIDVARTADDSWHVLSSRADTVNGTGYALENRIVVKQVFAELFAEMRVRRLASFFHTYRSAVRGLAANIPGRAVLMTPGPHNESYFEHAFLAHYLDLTLVEGDDLVTHGDRVYLRTINGLERVSAIFRRVDSDFCDPLELRGDSALGVPGLINAVRRGNVVLANALGGGVIESPAMDAYLPGIARALLGEELLIADIPTVWCGTSWGRAEALARLDRVIVRDAFDARPLFSKRSSARLGRALTTADIAALKGRMARRGASVVTQDIVTLGRAPVYEAGQIHTRPVSLRLFVAWTGDGYQVMPGALARVAGDDDAIAMPLQSGATSKDVWVPSVGPVNTFSLLRLHGEAVQILRTGASPPSRAMDNLFWLGRYSERAETFARCLRTVVERMGEQEPDDADAAAWGEFLSGLARLPLRRNVPHTDENVLLKGLHGLICDRNKTDGLAQLLQRVRQTAWSARDRLSLDTWQTIQQMTEDDVLPAADGAFDNAQVLSCLDLVIRRAAAFSGFCAENMTRGPNWQFTDLGRRIERADHLAWLVGRIAAPSAINESERVRLGLDIAGSTMTYRSRYFTVLQMRPLSDLLLFDESNPQSVAFQLAAIEKTLNELWFHAPVGQSAATAAALQRATALRAWSAEADLLSGETTPTRLAAYLEHVEESLCGISDAVTDAYFRHTIRRRTGGKVREV